MLRGLKAILYRGYFVLVAILYEAILSEAILYEAILSEAILYKIPPMDCRNKEKSFPFSLGPPNAKRVY